MSKIKRGSPIGKSHLIYQISRGKEIAPLYSANEHLPFARRVQIATAQAWEHGYLAVAVSKSHSTKADVYVFDGGSWQPSTWAFGKWGHPKHGLHFQPVHRLTAAPRPLLLLPARVAI